MRDDAPSVLDHLVYATPDLEATSADLERHLGIRAAPGGRHPDRGTMNALIALSPSSYLEIIGPDPGWPGAGPRWFGIDGLPEPRLVAWAVKVTNVDELAESAKENGVPLGPVTEGSRGRSDGTLLRWRFTDPAVVVGDGLVPFLIDWGTSPHPATSAPAGLRLRSLRARHPRPREIRRLLAVVGVDLPVDPGSRPALIADLEGSSGHIDLT
jgi:hypothetical protein